ncbi:C2H2 finger domain protein [Penicillium atrosanguineum]|uniref:C2H2 finger domain protein n=1 Tax=Penicillium atrosanguineum TaxID=1132637 RepID=A0A9W9U2F7_9EURO|nr:C2H2 finger domain protein [Penicillium atrosanguineum]
MECELPCEDSVFNSRRPFAEPNFRSTRRTTISEAFRYLFEDNCLRSPSWFDSSPISLCESNPMGLTIFDICSHNHLLTISLHAVLHAYINQNLGLLPFQIRNLQATQRPQPPGCKETYRLGTTADLKGIGIIRALSRWREYWVKLHRQLSRDEWTSIGFCKNGYKFYLVLQLIVDKGSIDKLKAMEMQCEDRMETLRALLLDENQ